MIPTICLPLLFGYICFHDPLFDRGRIEPRAIFMVCADPPEQAEAIRVPACDEMDQPEEYP